MRLRRRTLLSLVWAVLLLAAVACSEPVPGGDGQHGLPSPESQVLEMASPTPSALPTTTSTPGPGPTAGAGPGQDLLPTATPATTPTPVAATSYVANGNPCVRSFYIIGPAAGGPGQSLLEPDLAGDPVLFILHDVRAAAFSPDGTTLLASDGQVRLWAVADGAPLQAISEVGEFSQLTFSPDGGFVGAVRAEDEPSDFDLLQLWDADTGRKLPPYEPGGWILAYRFSPDGGMVAVDVAAGEESGFRLVDIASREERRFAPARTDGDGDVQGGPHHPFAFSPDGKLLATADGRIVQLWDTRTGEELHRLEGRAVATEDGEPAWAEGHASRVFDLAFSPDGRVLLTAGGDWSLRLWAVAGGEHLGCFEAPVGRGSFYRVTFSPDGRQFAASMLADDYSEHVYMWQSESGHLAYEVDGSFSGGARFDPASERLVTTLESNVFLWDVATAEQVALLQHPGTVSRATFSDDGAALAVETWIYDEETGDSRSSVWVWNARHPELFGGARE